MQPTAELIEEIVDSLLFARTDDPPGSLNEYDDIRKKLSNNHFNDVKVVVFGGGTGLSNIIGGDSRKKDWHKDPFTGLKSKFPKSKSVVCVTDNGGSTGELLKHHPFVAVGDLRHVLLSSIQVSKLTDQYNILPDQALNIVSIISKIFNYRLTEIPKSLNELLLSLNVNFDILPEKLKSKLKYLLELIFCDERLSVSLCPPNSLGNLLILSSIYNCILPDDQKKSIKKDATICGLNEIAELVGASYNSVLPCSSTQAQLKVRYTNGVEVTGEYKIETSNRGYPVEQVKVDFRADSTEIYPELLEAIENADILIIAPGSLYSSIIPVLQMPGIAKAIVNNNNALKVLISNLWVQKGETDRATNDPSRNFYASDLINALSENVDAKIEDLFDFVLSVSMKDISASIIQEYALENKSPIFYDRQEISKMGLIPIECNLFSKTSMEKYGYVQHDPEILAEVIGVLWAIRECCGQDYIKQIKGIAKYKHSHKFGSHIVNSGILLCDKYREIHKKITSLPVDLLVDSNDGLDAKKVHEDIVDIIWSHPDIETSHLCNVKGVRIIENTKWHDHPTWNKVFSYYDIDSGYIVIRYDQILEKNKYEFSVLFAIGQSLLGNYAKEKYTEDIVLNGERYGFKFHLRLRDKNERECFLDDLDLKIFLELTRMVQDSSQENHFIRLINNNENFTPPGMFMGLMYVWYLDNRLATHIEYKMFILKIKQSDLIPAQLNMFQKRKKTIDFFRNKVFIAPNG